MKQQLCSAVLALILATPVFALDKEPFSKERFDELQANNELILIDVFADWCSTCAKQQEVLKQYREEHPDVDLHILNVDFDQDKEWVRHFRAPRQATLLVYRGDEQYWYSVAETRRDVIFEAINKAAGAQ